MDVDVPETSVDPRNLRAELVKQFKTTTRYAMRQGLSADELHLLVDQTVQEAQATPIVFPEIELRDKGINDMRGKVV